MSNDDEQIVKSVLNGQAEAFGLLLDKYSGLIFRYFAGMLGPGDGRIDDLCQETFTAAYSGLPSLDNKANFKAWLLGIAANKMRSEFRSRKKDRTIAANITFEEKLSDEEIGSDIREVRIKELVEKAMSGLPEEMKQVIILKYFNELSYEEIAEILNVPKSTVRGRMHRAYQTLKTIFQDERV